MKCEDCGNYPATVYFVADINGQHVEKRICQDCAQKRQLSLFGAIPLDMTSLLSSILGATQTAEQLPKGAACPRCGMTSSDIVRTGKLGCAQCYDEFESTVEPLLRRIHGRAQHVGKIPDRSGGVLKAQRDLETLKRKQKEAIEKENFEIAAQLRDEIRELEQQIAQRGEGHEQPTNE